MKFDIDKKRLIRILEPCVSVVDQRAPMPVLQNVRLAVKGNGLTVSSQSLTQSMSGSVDCNGSRDGSCLVEAKKVLDRVKPLPDGDARLEFKDMALVIKSVAHSRKFSLSAIPDDDWPRGMQSDDSAPTINVSSSLLATLIGSIQSAVSTDVGRAALNSALIEIEPECVRVVGTDGHRVHIAEATAKCGAKKTMLVPLASLRLVRSIASASETNLGLSVSGSSLFVAADGMRLGVKLSDAQFPPYDQIVPKRTKTKATVDRAALLSSAKALMSTAGESSGVKIHSEDDALTLSCSGLDNGEGEDQVAASTVGKATVGLNVKYLCDALTSVISDKVVLYFDGELDPVLIVPDDASEGFDFTVVTMPMRI